MAGIKRNIFFSALFHAVIAASAIILSGVRDASFSVPADHVLVSLFEEMAGNESEHIKARRKEDAQMKRKDSETSVPDKIDFKSRTGTSSAVMNKPIFKDSDSGSETEAWRRLFSGDDKDWAVSEGNGDAVAGVNGKGESVNSVNGGNAGIESSIVGDKKGIVSQHFSLGEETLFIVQIRESIIQALIYPQLARRRRQEGTVVTEFSINLKGLPHDIKIIKSSGFNILDMAAKDTIVRAAPFPAVKDTIELPITFSLKNTAAYE